MRFADASLTALTAALALGLGFAACAADDSEDYPVQPGGTSSTVGAGPGDSEPIDTDDGGFPVDGGTLGPDGSGSRDGGPGADGGAFDGPPIGTSDGGVGFDGDFTPLEDAS